MAYEIPGFTLGTVTASADLSAKIHKFVKVSGANTVTVGAAVSDKVIGVLQNAPASGSAAVVMVTGVTKVVAGGTITAGDEVSCDANGDAIAATGSGTYVAGKALTGASDNDVVSVLLGFNRLIP
jgi:hypothetical protein